MYLMQSGGLCLGFHARAVGKRKFKHFANIAGGTRGSVLFPSAHRWV